MLTAKQKRFRDEYLKSLNATDAARRAGYKHARSIGYRLLRHPILKEEIQKEMDERSERLKIDADFVLKELYELYQRVMQEVKPALNSKTGKPITDEDGNALYTFNANAALKSLELIGKHMQVDAFAANKVSVDGNLTLIEKLQAARSRAGMGNRNDD